MAGAGQPWYMPLTWPIGHVTSAFSRSDDEKAPPLKATPDLDLIGHMTALIGASRAFGLALLCIFVLTDDYPAFGRAKTFEADWMLSIIVRNVVATYAIAGFWDWFLYISPLQDKLHKYKMNPVYPSTNQMLHDAFYSTIASIFAAFIEIGMCHLWATGKVEFQKNMMDTPISNLLWAITITHWRIPHFHAIHRAMHPWFPKNDKRVVPDLGRFLYRHVHSLHHKSYNPTAFSGTNMHPVEATLYYSASLICVPFGCHPAIFLACIIDCGVGAWLGHDGFQWPGSGDYFHQLHHTHFECNYGAMHIPIDKWLGTYAGGKKAVSESMLEETGCETAVHNGKQE